MRVPEYPDWEPDSHMHLWSRVEHAIVKLMPETQFGKSIVRIKVYTKPYEEREDIIMEMKIKEVQQNMRSILAVERIL